MNTFKGSGKIIELNAISTAGKLLNPSSFKDGSTELIHTVMVSKSKATAVIWGLIHKIVFSQLLA